MKLKRRGDYCAIISVKMNMWNRFDSFVVRGKALAFFLFEKLLKQEDTKNINYKSINNNSFKSQISLNRKKIWFVSSMIVLFVILFFAINSVYAEETATKASKLIMNWVIAIIAKLVIWLAEALGFVLIFLIDFLIKIVQYNNFVKATPVQIGWPLIRDTMNMFFIVVVLVSAFATIIGYPKEFRYRDVLPKLLLMAVLINFSKTLIGLMIDFSQVVVLTFVNGFKQAAGGNFVQALGIAKIMRLKDTTGTIEETPTGEIKISLDSAGETSAWSLLNIVVSAVFAIWIISISITLILIMIVFFLARIIMLWFLLITSPIAFFAWSLPSSLKKALSSFSDEWWNRMSNALIGGPTMAFFLWLSLAMAQRHTDFIGAGGLYDPKGASSEIGNYQKGSESVWGTEFGEPDTFATFIIMVAFMLLGVQVSVKFAGSVAPGSEKILSFLKSGGAAGIGVAGVMAAGKLAGKATATAARTTGRVAVGGAKLAGKGAKLAGSEILKRTDFAQKLAGDIRKDRFLQMVLPDRAQKAIGKFAGSHQERAKEKEASLTQIMSGMTATERDQYLQQRLENVQAGPLPDKAEELALQSMIVRNASSELYKEGLLKENREKARQEMEPGASAEAVESRARTMTDKIRGSRLENAREHAMATHDEEALKRIDSIFEKEPHLMTDYDRKRDLIADLTSNPNLQNKVSDDSYMEAFTAWHSMKERGWVDDEGRLMAGVSANKDYQEFMKGRQGNLMRAHLEYAKTDQGREKVKAILQPARGADGKIDATAMDKNNYSVSLSKNNKEFHVVPKNADAPANERYQARFDRKTNDATRIFSDENLRDRATQLMPALGADAKVEQIGTQLSKPAQAEFVSDLEELKDLEGSVQMRDGKAYGNMDDVENYNAKRDEIAKKYVAQGVSTEALLGHDKNSGNLSDAGKESLERIMGGHLDSLQKGSLKSEDVSSLAGMLQQIGTKGEAGEQVMGMISQKMQSGEINHSHILNLMRMGSAEDQKTIRQAFAEYGHQAQQDYGMLKQNTVAQSLYRQLLDQPKPSGVADADARAIDASRRVRNIMILGKENS